MPSGDQIEQAIIREQDSGLFFCVDASYVEQEIAPIHSPYGNGVVQLPEGDDGSDAEPSILKEKYGKDGEHPKFKRKAWLASVNDGKYDAGYWDWVSFYLKSSHVIRAHEKATKKVEEYVTGKHSEMLWKKIVEIWTAIDIKQSDYEEGEYPDNWKWCLDRRIRVESVNAS